MAKRPAEEELLGIAKKGAGPPWANGDQQEDEEKERPDDELDPIGIPTGWRQCPRMGQPIDRFIPMKVPLGAWFDSYIKPEDRFSPQMAKEMADSIAQRMPPLQGQFPPNVGMVVDLTRSRGRYYDPEAWINMGMRFCKIPCQGRGEAPAPALVNEFVGDVVQYILQNPGGLIMVHCTHGFNRTGYMIVSYLVRMLAISVHKALDMFTRGRAPGIYKHYYIRQLSRYYHERLPHNFPYPAVPDWKGGDSPERVDEEEEPQGDMHHEDVLGEEISLAEYHEVVQFVLGSVPAARAWDGTGEPVFPGSQPVSLARSNIDKLKNERYWVTWKADGTRYMIAIMRYGTYLVDRKFHVRRVQMRFPQMPPPGCRDKPVGPPHNGTLLDGEMVVDEDLEGNQTRRFLIYDLVALNKTSLADRPWKDRYAMIEELVVRPRSIERHKIETNQWGYPYEYNKELFRVRRKEFWPLPKADNLLNKFIPNLCHEADGLIFQPYYTAYICGTCDGLLKWKFPHMNSVDFQLKLVPGWEPQLLLLHPRKNRDYMLKPLEDARVIFPEGDSPEYHDGNIVECAYDHEQQAWTYMRERRDKKLPNAYRVYEKVFDSIKDNITEADILGYVEATLELPIYDRDMGRNGGQPQQQQRRPPPQQQQRPQQGQHEQGQPPPQQQHEQGQPPPQQQHEQAQPA